VADIAWERNGRAPAGTLIFDCNICSSRNQALAVDLDRERRSCALCDSTVRWRSVVSLLSSEMFGRSLRISDFPTTAGELVGIGMSDWTGYASRLAEVTNYTNTFFDREPRLDIMALSPELIGTCDFVLSSEVMEHVPRPVRTGFGNLRRLMRSGGLLVLTVPFAPTGTTVEHFAELHDFELVGAGGDRMLRNTTPDGAVEEYDNLIFHGGNGFTLEMRVFSLPCLIEDLTAPGFVDVKVHCGPVFEHGIYWQHEWSVPITARAS